jgi:hypothetical protein
LLVGEIQIQRKSKLNRSAREGVDPPSCRARISGRFGCCAT